MGLYSAASVAGHIRHPSDYRCGGDMPLNDEQAIISAVDAFTAAWSKGDAEGAASYYADDAVRVGAFGDIQQGRAAIEGALDRLLHATMPGAAARQERGTVR